MATHSSILAGRSHGQRSLVGYSPQGLNQSDLTEHIHAHTHTHTHTHTHARFLSSSIIDILDKVSVVQDHCLQHGTFSRIFGLFLKDQQHIPLPPLTAQKTLTDQQVGLDQAAIKYHICLWSQHAWGLCVPFQSEVSGLPWWLRIHLPIQGRRFQSQVRELRSYKSQSN